MSVKLTTILVDDDKFQLEVISEFILQTKFLSLVGTFSDPFEALQEISNNPPDLLLLDVEMPALSGIDLLKALETPPKTIFITGHKDYAIDAFEMNVIDYLVKPIDNYIRFLKAVTKAKQQHNPTNQTEQNDYLFVKEDSMLVKVEVQNIEYFEAYGDYVRIHSPGKCQVVHTTLTNILNRLPNYFIKVHRSFVVNLNHIVNLDQFNLQIGDKIVPVSKKMRPLLIERIETL